MIKQLEKANLYITLTIVSCYVILTTGFMLVRVPPTGFGIPIGECLIIFNFGIYLFSSRKFVGACAVLPIPILAAWWVYGCIQIVIGLVQHGVWAIRDASQMIESTYLLIGFWLATHPLFINIFVRWVKGSYIIAAIYSLGFPFEQRLSEFSPKIPSISGYSAPLFFSYNNLSSGVFTGVMALMSGGQRSSILKMIFCGFLIMNLIVFFQARIVYLHLVLICILFVLFKASVFKEFVIVGVVTAIAMVMYLQLGIQMPGRLGESFTMDFLVNHIEAIWGGGNSNVSAAAKGVDLRLSWWIDINQRVQCDLPNFLFGLGYGEPLTSFRGPSDDIVREPHNSLMSIYGRLGVTGVILFLSMQFSILWSVVQSVILATRRRLTQIAACALTVLAAMGMMLIFSAVEGGFEVSFVCIPYYFFAGVMFVVRYQLGAPNKIVYQS